MHVKESARRVNRRAVAAWRGAVDMLPLSLAVLPWGVLFGSLAIQRGFDWLQTMLFSSVVFGGAVQIVSVELMAGDATVLTVLFSAFVISSRHFLYGLALRERLAGKPLRWRLPLSFLLTDEQFALSTHPRAYQNRYRLYYAMGSGVSFYLAWNLWTAIGISAGSILPDMTALGLEFAIAATFIALVVPGIKSLDTLVAVLVAGLCSVLFTLWQFELALVCSALAGMLGGYSVSRWRAGR